MMNKNVAVGRPYSEQGLAGSRAPQLSGVGPAGHNADSIHIPGRERPEAAPISGARADDARPTSVPGPLGQPITMETLPPADTRRWVVRRKAEVIAAIRGGLLTAAEACARYRLSPEELELWQESLDRAGVPGLRVTRIQLYRDYPLKPVVRAEQPAAPAKTDLSRSWGL
jgi:hypothetical protein